MELISGFRHQLRHGRAPVALRRQRRAEDGLRQAAPRGAARRSGRAPASQRGVEEGEANGGATQRCPEGPEMVRFGRIEDYPLVN